MYVCSFAASAQWGVDPEKLWIRKCTEEAGRHIACEAPVDGKPLVIKRVSKPERSTAQDGITYYEVTVVTGVA